MKTSMEQIKELAIQGLERCDEPQWSILNEIIRLAQEKPTARPTEYKTGGVVKACNCIGPENCNDTGCALVHDDNRNPTPAKQEDGLVEELREWSREYGLSCEPEIEDMTKAYEAFNKILTLRKRSE